MKKAKVMLSTLAVLAVLSTAFAFKAKTFTAHTVFTGSSATDCTHQLTGTTISPVVVGTATYASIASTTSGCPLTYTTTAEE